MIAGQLAEEVRLWNTPLVGAYLLWRFTQGYCKGHPNGEAPIGLLHFLAMAILTSKKLIRPVTDQREGLQSYVRSFESTNDSDILLTIQDRVREKREYTLSAIDVAVAEGFLAWEADTGRLHPSNLEKLPDRGRALKTPVRRDGDRAEILGKWFSKHNVPTIAAYTRVVF